jgi:lipoyl(octanoyl) transferase
MSETLHLQRHPLLETYLLGVVDFEECLALQQRLVYEAGGRKDGQIVLLLCEHPPTITIGRQGSRLHLLADEHALASRQWSVRWVNRGGGAFAHAPGQLAIYPIVPLHEHGWSVGEYLDRFQTGLTAVLEHLHIRPTTRSPRHGLWGRSGQLVGFGVAIKGWITYHGAFVNVDIGAGLLRAVASDPETGAAMSSLAMERQQPIKMSLVRSLVVPHLSAAFGCQEFRVYSRHPLFRAASQVVQKVRRVG